jgi:hypothetical protein
MSLLSSLEILLQSEAKRALNEVGALAVALKLEIIALDPNPSSSSSGSSSARKRDDGETSTQESTSTKQTSSKGKRPHRQLLLCLFPPLESTEMLRAVWRVAHNNNNNSITHAINDPAIISSQLLLQSASVNETASRLTLGFLQALQRHCPRCDIQVSQIISV